MHSTDDMADGYLGSGVRIGRSIKKHGKKNHIREILEMLPTRKQASVHEKELLTQEFRTHPLCMNCGPGGLGAVDLPPSSEETKRKISAGNTRRWAKTKAERSAVNDVQVVLKVEEVLNLLIMPNGHINKNAARMINKVQTIAEMPSRTREANVVKRWRAVCEMIGATDGSDPVPKIKAFVKKSGTNHTCSINNSSLPPKHQGLKMNLIESLQESRKLAGLNPMTVDQQVELAEKKLSGKEKEDFLAKMGGKKAKKDDKDDGVDNGSGETASKAARKAMDAASIKGSVSGKKGVKMKKRVSESVSEILEAAGIKGLTEDEATKIDEAVFIEEDAAE